MGVVEGVIIVDIGVASLIAAVRLIGLTTTAARAISITVVRAAS